jgi:hypothetical protein
MGKSEDNKKSREMGLFEERESPNQQMFLEGDIAVRDPTGPLKHCKLEL